MTFALAKAAAAWREQSPRARRDAIDFFRDEANQSDNWCREDKAAGHTGKRHREDAKALRAAVRVLRAASKGRR